MKSEGNISWRGENYLAGLHNTAAVDAEPTELGLQKYGHCAAAAGHGKGNSTVVQC